VVRHLQQEKFFHVEVVDEIDVIVVVQVFAVGVVVFDLLVIMGLEFGLQVTMDLVFVQELETVLLFAIFLMKE